MSETHFQNTETALKNQQASIQGLETQIGQLSKLISERPQDSLPSNTEPNPREQLNAINTQDDEGVIEPELEPRQETVVSLHFVWETKRSPFKLVILASHQTLKKLNFKEVHEPCSKDDRGHIHEERRLRIEELDEWGEHKLRTYDKLKLHLNKPDTSPNQLKVGDKVLLDAADPHIVTTTPNEEISLTVLSIFPFGTVEVNHPKFGTFKVNTGMGIEKHGCARGKARFCFFDTSVGEVNKARHSHAIWPCATHTPDTRTWDSSWARPKLQNSKNTGSPSKYIMSSSRGKKAVVPSSKDVRDRVLPRYVLQPNFGTRSLSFSKLRRRSYFRYYVHDPSLQVVMTNNDDPGTIHFRLGGLVRAMSVPEFGVALGHYTDEFMKEEDMNALPHNIHISPSSCWKALAPLSSTYDPSRSKASALAPSLRYLHAILAHTLTGRRESTGVVNTHDTYYLWCMTNAHVTDLHTSSLSPFAIRPSGIGRE
ncbi:hypothetical protein GOBAR_AA12954 [Gossypium barbadense]|uniref:Uncharacterized protein n=1 Tax=Gossypium barbadense TaxID=3634 RepID=A0A2P5XWG1_GOSBA|nr:hypothetical protein GOBAR_AA12954 [Gossypium barbadense]